MQKPHRLNCWEFRNCGREPGGVMVPLLGQCPVTKTMKLDGRNGGVAAGRSCWLVPDSGCRQLAQSEGRSLSCHECTFYRRVIREEKGKVEGALHSVPA